MENVSLPALEDWPCLPPKSTRWQLVTMALALFSLSVCCISGAKASQLLIPDFQLGLLGLIFGGFELRNDME